MMNPKQAMWKHMIQRASVKDGRDSVYWGLGTDIKTTNELREKMASGELKHMIDWEKTSNIKDERHSVFVGTFAEADWELYREGTLVLNNGEEYTFMMQVNDGYEFSDIVNMVFEILQNGEEF